jgi:hypothetical protein
MKNEKEKKKKRTSTMGNAIRERKIKLTVEAPD